MKVYVAKVEYAHEAGFEVGVFSSRELAEAFLEEHYFGWGDSRNVYEYELDVGEK